MAHRDPLDELLTMLRRPGLRDALDDPAQLRGWAEDALAERPRRRHRPAARLLVLAAALTTVVTALHSQGAMGPARPEVALVNGQPITRGVLAENAEQRYGAAMLETSVMAEVLRQAAERAGLQPTEADIDAGLERIRLEQFRGDTQRFETWRHSGGRRETVLRREVAAQLAAFRLRSRGVKINDAELRTYHKEHRDRYSRPESYFYRIIYIPWPDVEGKRAPEGQARAKAKAELDKILRGGDFEAAARLVSEDDQAERTGGRVGPQPAELLPEEFRPLFKDAKPGQVITEPVMFRTRFVLLQFLSHAEPFAGEYDQVRGLVESDFLVDKLAPQSKFMADLARAAKIEVVEPRYAGHAVTGHWFSPSGLTMDGWLVSE